MWCAPEKKESCTPTPVGNFGGGIIGVSKFLRLRRPLGFPIYDNVLYQTYHDSGLINELDNSSDAAIDIAHQCR